MPTHTAPQSFAIQTVSETHGAEGLAPLFPALPSFEDALGRVREKIAFARRNPHEALALFVLSCVGGYFSWVGMLVFLCGPAE